MLFFRNFCFSPIYQLISKRILNRITSHYLRKILNKFYQRCQQPKEVVVSVKNRSYDDEGGFERRDLEQQTACTIIRLQRHAVHTLQSQTKEKFYNSFIFHLSKCDMKIMSNRELDHLRGIFLVLKHI